jgi:hypothetical protein
MNYRIRMASTLSKSRPFVEVATEQRFPRPLWHQTATLFMIKVPLRRFYKRPTTRMALLIELGLTYRYLRDLKVLERPCE